MPLPPLTEKYATGVNVVTIGATREEGGTRQCSIKVGGAKTLPFMDVDGDKGLKPVIAMDVMDIVPEEWPEVLAKPFKDVWNDPGKWAKACVEKYGADMICVKLDGIDPDKGNRTPEQAVETVKRVLDSVGCPLIVWGSENDEKDNLVMPKVSQALRGERCLLGTAKEDNYKVITAVCLADGHNLITLAPLDINLGKQVNILVTDLEFPLDRIVMFQTTGALGYGLEYAYTIQERQRLAALTGDKMMMCPMICDCGHESWRAKEAKASDEDAPQWGPQALRGPAWEAATAAVLVQSGADILRMRHPDAVAAVKQLINQLWG